LTQTTHYSSVLAKIGAERGNFVNETKLKVFAESKSPTEFAAQLRDSNYQKQIAKIIPPFTSRKLERAFNENLIVTYIKIIKYSPKKAREYLRLYLLKFEIENIKALMNATAAKLPPEQKKAKIYFSVEDYFKRTLVFEEATKASTPAQLIHSFKGTDYWLPLNIGLKNYEESASTISFDIFLDKLYFEKLFDYYGKLSKKEQTYANFYASIENDGFTLITLLRGKTLNYEPNWLRLVVPQNYFNLSKQTIEDLVSSVDFEAALKIVLDSYYSKYFAKTQTPEETIAVAEKAFKKAILQHAKSSLLKDVFNIGLPLAFITQKEAEIYNLGVLSLGIESAMKPEEIRSLLL
jgi:V/A-type H+-transporting ATPase subunit C